MKMRAARFTDAPELAKILAERQADSRYAGAVEVDEPYARKLVAAAIGRHGGQNEGACFVMVAADKDDRAQAFIFGQLVRVYAVGNKLAASDVFLIGRKGVSGFQLDRLFDAYVKWAEANPKVYEIGASHANTIAGSERFKAVFQRRGFTKVGEVFTLIRQEQGAMGSLAA
jgi:hypothetical protein